MPSTEPGQINAHPTDRNVAFLVGLAGWTLDAFDFFLVVFCLTDIGHEFHKSDVSMAFALTITLALRPLGALVFANVVAAVPGRLAANTKTALVLRSE